MPQLQLPLFPDGLTPINEDLAFQRQDGQVVYFHGLMPVFQDGEKDLKSFRMFTNQLIATGTAPDIPATGDRPSAMFSATSVSHAPYCRGGARYATGDRTAILFRPAVNSPALRIWSLWPGI